MGAAHADLLEARFAALPGGQRPRSGHYGSVEFAVSGRLKVMASLHNWFREFRKYHRDDKGSGRIVKRDDHLMDATRYLTVSGRLLMRTEPRHEEPYCPPPFRGRDAWMA